MDKATKQRLLGGLVLVAGAALFLPMLLDGSGAALTVPPMPAPPAVAGVDEISPRLESAVKQAEQSVAEAHDEVVATVEEDVAPDTAALPDGAEEASRQAAAALAAEKAAQARSLADKAAEEKLTAEKLAVEKAAAQKLAAEKAAQEKLAQEKLAREKAAQDAKAEQARQQAVAKVDKASDKTATDALPSAWVVQVASLSSRDNANALAQRLRQKNYRSSVQQQGALWRVLVGPELSREVAESVKARLATDPDFKLSGLLQAYKP